MGSFHPLGFCPEVRNILNGKVFPVTPIVGKAAVEFRCHKNFRLVGRTRLECINGRWNGMLPYCQGKLPKLGHPTCIYRNQICHTYLS